MAAAEVSLRPAVLRALDLLGDSEWEGSLAELARSCGVSEACLSRIFTRQVAVPLNRYRNSVRLARFLELSRRRKRGTLQETAYAAGFGSYAQFFKVFTKAYGNSPRATMRRPD